MISSDGVHGKLHPSLATLVSDAPRHRFLRQNVRLGGGLSRRPHPISARICRPLRYQSERNRGRRCRYNRCRERQTGEFLAERFDALQASRWRPNTAPWRSPFVDARKQRFGVEGDDLPQFVAHDFREFLLRSFRGSLVARAPRKQRTGLDFPVHDAEIYCDESGRSMRWPSLRAPGSEPGGSERRTSSS